MEHKKITEANKLLEQLESYEERLKKLGNSKAVDYIEIRHYQSGAPEYSYEVVIREHEDKEFLLMVRSMIEARLTLSIDRLKKQIEAL